MNSHTHAHIHMHIYIDTYINNTKINEKGGHGFEVMDIW